MTSDPIRPRAASHSLRRLLRIVLPFAVSGLLLAYLFDRIDLAAALDHMTGSVVRGLALPFVLFNLVTLAIEARCLTRVAAAGHVSLPVWTAARIKAACYLLNVINYALGAAGLSVLLRRRAGIGLADAASMVFLISLFDVGSVLSLVAIGASFLQVDAIGIRTGIVAALIGAIVGGFVFLRAPWPMGPLDAVRDLDLFRAPRRAPLSLLLELAFLRGLFLLTFVALMAALLHSFAIEVGWLRMAMNVAILVVVSALPIAAGGIGTGQIAFVALFSGLAPDAELLAASIVLSIGLITTRAVLGLLFAPEFTREVLRATHAQAPIPEPDDVRRPGRP